MRRALIVLLIFGLIMMLGCAEKKPVVEKPIETPTEQAPKPIKSPVEDINKTLTDVDNLLEELHEIENISFNL